MRAVYRSGRRALIVLRVQITDRAGIAALEYIPKMLPMVGICSLATGWSCATNAKERMAAVG